MVCCDLCFVGLVGATKKKSKIVSEKNMERLSDCRGCLQTPGTETGRAMYYLAGLAAELPHVNNVSSSEPAEPKHDTMDAFRGTLADRPDLKARTYNKVRVCPHCSKACAYTLKCCNACGSSLEEVPLSYNDNVFMGFIYGVGKGRFPYTISMRKQTPELLCFDDPLSLSVCHMNAIPTDVYCPDLRYLFTNPDRGLKLVNALNEIGAKAALEQFWSNDAVRNKYFGGCPVPEHPLDLMKFTICGMNFPPSMYQLHLQYIHAPMTSFQYSQAMEANHFHHGRFFPLEFLQSALKLGEKAKMSISEDTEIEAIISKMKDLGVNYDEIHGEMMRKCKSLQEQFQPWAESDFKYYVNVTNGKVLDIDGLASVPRESKEINAEDTKLLQNYGRPYDESGKTTGTYYSYAKEPMAVEFFG